MKRLLLKLRANQTHFIMTFASLEIQEDGTSVLVHKRTIDGNAIAPVALTTLLGDEPGGRPPPEFLATPPEIVVRGRTNSSLGQVAAHAIGKFLHFCPHLERLTFRKIIFENSNLIPITESLLQCKKLSCLVFQDCLSRAGTSVESLNRFFQVGAPVKNFDLTITEAFDERITEALQRNQSLEKLCWFLTCDLNDDQIGAFEELISNHQGLRSLELFFRTPVGTNVTEKIANALAENCCIESLVYFDYHKDEGVAIIMDALTRRAHTYASPIRSLYLCNRIAGEKSAAAIQILFFILLVACRS